MATADEDYDFDSLDEQIENAENGADSDDGGDEEYEDLPWIKAIPRVAVKGTLVGAGFTGDTGSIQNIQGTDGTGNDVAIELENPDVLLGDLYEQRDRKDAENGTLARQMDDAREPLDYRVVDSDDGVVDTSLWEDIDDGSDGPTDVGIEVYNQSFHGDEVTTFADETVTLFVGGQAGRLVAQSVDADPRAAYIDDDGNITKGLIEYPFNYKDKDWEPWADDSDDYWPRLARTPVVHPELLGEEVILYFQWGDEYNGNRKHHCHVLLNDADSLGAMTNLTQESPFEPQPDHVEADPWLEFRDFSSDGADSDDGGGDDYDPFGGGDDGDDGNGGAGTASVEYDDLTARQQSLVDSSVETVRDNDGGLNDVIPDFEGVVEQEISNGNIEEVDPSAVRDIVEERV